MLEESQGVTASLTYALSPAVKDFIAGAAGGSASVLAGHPLDTVRIRLQHGRTDSIQVIARALLAKEGPKALFKGAVYPLLTVAIQSAVVFQSYGVACRAITSKTQSDAPLSYSLVCAAGMFAGAVQTLISTPVDLLKIRQQLQLVPPGSPQYVGPLQLLRHILSTEGLPGLYRGACITLLRDVPAHAIYFTSYEACHEIFAPGSRASGQPSAAVQFCGGGLAGMLSWLGIYHFDVIKTRLQSRPRATSPYSGWMHCAAESYRQEGRGVFFRGLGTTLCRAFVVNAVLFSVYEAALQGLHSHDPANAA
ncbi:g2712 [Coccomyxa elongata]